MPMLSPTYAELLHDAALALPGVPPEEREALRKDVVSFLREDVAPQSAEAKAQAELIARADIDELELLQQLLLELSVELAKPS